MERARTGFGGIVGLLGAGAFAIAVLVFGLWISKQRDARALLPVSEALEANQTVTAERDTQRDPTTLPKGAVSAPTAEVDVQAGAPADPVAALDAAAPTEAPEDTAAAAPVAAPAASDTDEQQAVAMPAFDEVRRESDGLTVIAGRAAPGAQVTILKDGEALTQATADATGKFAAIAIVPADGKGHVLSLDQDLDGVVTRSDEEIILAPTQMPQIADAETAEPDPAVAAQLEDAASVAGTEAGPEDAPQITERTAAERDETAPMAAEETTDPLSQPEAMLEPTEIARADPSPAPTPSVAEAPGVDPETERLDDPARTSPAQPEPKLLKSTGAGVELLEPAAPQIMSNVELDLISYSEAGDVQLAGRAQGQADRVRIYLDNRAVADLPVDADGRWRGDIPNVDEGVYTLRVDEVGQDGVVMSRVETPFKREAADLLAAASAGADVTAPISAVTVQKGDTLWAISRERYGDGLLYVRVFEANADAIRDPDLIYPGQVFDLPE